MAVNEAELGGGNRKVRVPQRKNLRSQASARPSPVPDGDAADNSDGRAIEVHQRFEAALHRVAEISRRRRLRIDVAEFGNVGAGAEMRPFALDKHDQQVVPRFDLSADRRQRAPHRACDRIAALGAVKDDAGERGLEAQGYVGHESLGTASRDVDAVT